MHEGQAGPGRACLASSSHQLCPRARAGEARRAQSRAEHSARDLPVTFVTTNHTALHRNAPRRYRLGRDHDDLESTVVVLYLKGPELHSFFAFPGRFTFSRFSPSSPDTWVLTEPKHSRTRRSQTTREFRAAFSRRGRAVRRHDDRPDAGGPASRQAHHRVLSSPLLSSHCIPASPCPALFRPAR